MVQYLMRLMSIRENIKKINTHLSGVRLIAVSKTRAKEELVQAIEVGQKDFGENYVQEALTKINELKKYHLIWHFIGPIQSNKTALIAENFDWVHSVDRLKIAKRLNDQRPKNLGKLKILIQVNIDNEITKSGVSLLELSDLIDNIKSFKNLSLEGLMCIPKSSNSVNAFIKMQELKNKYQLKELSMGMSNDFDQAVKYGATMVRLGSIIFGQRE
ncbi:Hypothetical protein YggS, proline synthase co-transcribed bacterial homolog PROSC [hydrothermal vent metagenome]|uniref:Alanine racemase N-terminal domain-containing protein n=1 Tax=hydrothermal vent metagenome TaxID=652676 RepID=A0A1W1CMY7_9ZZZZ